MTNTSPDQPSSSRTTPFGGPGARPILASSHRGLVSQEAEAGPSNIYSSPSFSSQPVSTRMEQKSPTPVSDQHATASPTQETTMIKRVGGKANVSAACGPCKRAHLACDVARPCKRCVNMGKEDQCEDVPHKKRGRPKVPKPALGEPYHRARPPLAEPGGVGKWRGPPPYDSSYIMGQEMPHPLMQPAGGRINSPQPRPMGLEVDPNFSASNPVQPFTLFTTTDFKILRATSMSYHLIGFHPNEFVNLDLLDWIHPQDKHLIDTERNRLLAVPYVEGALRSSEVSQAAIAHRNEMELLSPADGMREPYPNKNVRVLHADHRYSPFNVRLHLGGGLGASLWQPNTLGRIYLVVSFLAIPRPRDLVSEVPGMPPRRHSQNAPPTPISPVPPAPAGHGLPGFSSMAAAADAPQTRYEQQPQPYYPPPTQAVPLRPSSSSQHAYNYPRSAPLPVQTPPGTVPAQYLRRSSSPSATYRPPSNTPYAMPNLEYPLPVPSQGAYYPPPPEQGFRRASEEEQWRNMGGPGAVGGQGQGINIGVSASGMSGRGPPPPGSAGNDSARRAWEL
ncbi:hypothetical protein IAU60_004759 [Kwoniella sp. DSM 27419]